mgnify:CR=1 FL=1
MKQRILMRSEYDFFSTASTRWRDMDTLGHINHTVYLGLLERSKTIRFFSDVSCIRTSYILVWLAQA